MPVASFIAIKIPKNYAYTQMQEIANAIDKGLADCAKEQQRLFDKTTDTWSFETRPHSEPYHTRWGTKWKHQNIEMGVEYTPRDATLDLWGMLDKGTRRHVIRAKKRGGYLAFNSKFKPKTRPNVIASYAGSHGGPMVYRQQVTHPGTKARNWTVAIQKKAKPWIQKRMVKAFEEAVRQANAHDVTMNF